MVELAIFLAWVRLVVGHLTLPSDYLLWSFVYVLLSSKHCQLKIMKVHFSVSYYLTPKCVNHVENEWLP